MNREECAIKIIENNYGDDCKNIVEILFFSGPNILTNLVKKSKLPRSKVAETLVTLINRKFVEVYPMNNMSFYSVNLNNIIRILFSEEYSYLIQLTYGTEAELLVDFLLENGSAKTLELFKVVENLFNTRSTIGTNRLQIKNTFITLVKAHFIQRCQLKICHEEYNTFENDSQMRFSVDNLPVFEDGVNGAHSNDDISWEINFDRFNQFKRDKELVNLAETQFDKNTSNVLSIMLRIAETTTDKFAKETAPIYLREIKQHSQEELSLSSSVLDQCLKLLCDSPIELISKNESGSYVVNLEKGINFMLQSTISSFAKEKIDSKSSQIINLFFQSELLSQQQVSDLLLTYPNKSKNAIFDLFKENLLSLNVVGKSNDFSYHSNFYFLSQNKYELNCKILELLLITFSNLDAYKKKCTKENFNLIEKKRRAEYLINKGPLENGEELAVDYFIDSFEQKEMKKYEDSDFELCNSIRIVVDKLFFVYYWFISNNYDEL